MKSLHLLQLPRLYSGDFLRAGIDFLFPPCCPVCQRSADQKPSAEIEHQQRSWLPKLCSECEQQIVPRPAAYCRKCGAPAGPHLDTTYGCVYCKQDRFAFDSVYALGSYEGPLKNLIRQAKQPYGMIYAAALASHLVARHQVALEQAKLDCIVPVPKHWTQNIGKRYDAPLTLATSLASLLHVPVIKNCLVKRRRTPKQSTLPVSKRRTNLKQAFRARGDLTGRHILLVDDILTTGSTAQESVNALLQCGANRVLVAVIARGIGL